MTNLIEYANGISAEYPQLKSDIDGLIELCVAEIEDSGSTAHEIELCWSDIKELVKEYRVNTK